MLWRYRGSIAALSGGPFCVEGGWQTTWRGQLAACHQGCRLPVCGQLPGLLGGTHVAGQLRHARLNGAAKEFLHSFAANSLRPKIPSDKWHFRTENICSSLPA
jgi:hypothetical protein